MPEVSQTVPNLKQTGEKLIVEYLGRPGGTKANALAEKLPGILGGPIFLVNYLAQGLNLFGSTFYVVTNRRIKVAQGVMRQEIESVPLEDITDVRVANENHFSRTGDLECTLRGGRVFRMIGIQDPWPARQTILDAVHARVEIEKVLEQQRRARALKA